MINDVNLIWQSDTTYFRLGERWVYLTFIIDIYSRLIVGYAFSHSLRAEANVRALKMALANRKGADLSKLIFHSDGGTQYRFKPFVEQLRQRGISSSMCTAATDNAYAEKLNDVIKNEYLVYRSNQLGKRLSSILPQVVDNYCTRRHHGQLPLRCSPSEYEQWLLTEAGLEQRPRLLVRDGQSRRQEWEPDVGAKAFEHPLATAVAGVSQILPAHVKLDHPIQDRQLSLAFN
ncbi:MAG: DDE-type integrase/transposase/recombinase [Bacteroidota bacterium]